MEDKLFDLIKGAERILITTHISPDPDALSSIILLSETLRLNFPQKEIQAVVEDRPVGLEFLAGFDKVKFEPVFESLTKYQPDLFILLDGNNYERCSRHDGDKIRHYLKDRQIKTAIVDHHELAGKDEADVFINNGSAATVQEIYELGFEHMRLNKPPEAANIAMTGFYADTGGFVYIKAGSQKKLFNFAEELVSGGADIEAIKNQLETYSEDDMKVLAQLTGNLSHEHGYSFSLLSDEFIDQWAREGNSQLALQRPTNNFLNGYIRNIDDRRWGFIVYKNLAQGDNIYSVSLRSQAGRPDVSVIASALGGGGHKPAAGAKFEAANLTEALNKVKAVIAQSV